MQQWYYDAEEWSKAWNNPYDGDSDDEPAPANGKTVSEPQPVALPF
jgi:hypothetical protein